MKKWKIEITATDAREALGQIKLLKDAFEISEKYNMPLHYFYSAIDSSTINCVEISGKENPLENET